MTNLIVKEDRNMKYSITNHYFQKNSVGHLVKVHNNSQETDTFEHLYHHSHNHFLWSQDTDLYTYTVKISSWYNTLTYP